MTALTLPSGKQVQLRDPTYGEVVKLVLEQAADPASVLEAKVALIARGLSKAEVYELSFADGTALIKEVAAVWERVTADAD